MRGRFLKTGVIAIVCIAILMGLSVQGKEKEKDAPFKHRITCIIPHRPETVFWQEIEEGMQEAANENGIWLTSIYTESSEPVVPMDINSAIETAILVHTEAIILSYSKDAGEETDRLLRRARDEGIKVLLIDNDTDRSLRDACVTIDNYAAGSALGRRINEESAGREKVLLAYSNITSQRQNMADRMKGLCDVLGDRAVIYEVEDDLSADQTFFKQWEKVLEENPDIGAVVTLNERSTITASQLLARSGRAEKLVLYGFDWSEETEKLLEDGSIKALIGQQQSQMGYESIRAAVRLLEKGKLDSDKIFIDYQMY